MGRGYLPYILQNGQGNLPDANKLMENLAHSNLVQWNLINNGDMLLWDAGTTSPPNDWEKSESGLDVAQDTTYKKLGSYSVKLSSIVGGSAKYIYQSIDSSILNFYKDKEARAWVWVKCSQNLQARITLYDGVGETASDYHTGDGLWQLLAVTHDVAESATELTLRLVIENNFTSPVYFDAAQVVDFDDVQGWMPSKKDMIGQAESAAEAIASKVETRIITENYSGDTAHDITAKAGKMWNDSKTVFLELLTDITKQIDATFSPGNNAGGLASGASLSANAWYYGYIIEKISDGTIDFYFDDNRSATKIPSGYANPRLVGFYRTDGSANIRQFKQIGKWIVWLEFVSDYNASVGSTATLATMKVPPGEKCQFVLYGRSFRSGGANDLFFTDPDQPDTAVSSATGDMNLNNLTGENRGLSMMMMSNNNSQIRLRALLSSSEVRIGVFMFNPFLFEG